MADSIQEQLAAARKNQILDAAAKVFAQKGFHPTTIKDIAREAGIADGTIYNYFENKTALLFGIFDRVQQSILNDSDFSSLPETDLRAFLAAYLRQPLMAFKDDNFELFRVVVSEIMVNKELRELFHQKILEPAVVMAEMVLQQWAEQNLIKPNRTALTSRALSGMVFGLILEHITGDKLLASHWEELPEFLTDLILNGLRGDQS